MAGLHAKGSHQHQHSNGTIHEHTHFHKGDHKRDIHQVVHRHRHRLRARVPLVKVVKEVNLSHDTLDDELSGYLYSLYGRYARENKCSIALARVEVHTKLFRIVAEHLR